MRPQLQNWASFLIPEIFHQLDHFLHAASVVQNLSLQLVEIQLKLLLVGFVKRDRHKVCGLNRHIVLVSDAINPVGYFIRERSTTKIIIIELSMNGISRCFEPEVKLEGGDEVDLEERFRAGADDCDWSILVSGDSVGLTLVVKPQIQSSQHSVDAALQQSEHFLRGNIVHSTVSEDDLSLAGCQV